MMTGLSIPRYYTKEGVPPLDMFTYEKRTSLIKNADGLLKDGDDISIIPAIAGGAKEKLTTKRVTLVFPPAQIKEPAVFLMAKKFVVMPNIRKARVTETVGEMTLELEGTSKNLEAGIKFLESRGIKVEPVTGDSAS